MIYEPAEDSYLLQQTLEKENLNKDTKILEIGVGSGFILNFLKEKGFENISGIDINSEAVEYCIKEGLNVKQSDLFENVVGKYDIIIFNPPYLPKDKKEDQESQLATTGGKKGSEIINKFLIQTKNHLNTGGIIYLLISSLTQGVDYLNFKKKTISEKPLFFEKLQVLKLEL